MAYKTTKDLTFLRANPDPAAPVAFPLIAGTLLTSAGTKSDDGKWAKVNPPPGANPPCWLLIADAEEIADELPKVDPAGFVRTALLAERRFNARPSTPPFFVLADFVIARAIFETKLTYLPPQIPGSDGVGPLQVSSPEWKDFLANGKDFAEPFGPDDRTHPMMQIFGATYRMNSDAQKVSQAKLDGGIGSKGEPPLPSYLEVFLAYLTGNAKAAYTLADATSTAADKGKADAPGGAPAAAGTSLRQFLAGSMKDDEIAAFFKARPNLTGSIDSPKTVGDFVSNVEQALNDALKGALDDIKQFVPEELPVVKGGQAPWFAVAQAEQKRGVKEPDPHILDYFKAINFQTDTTKTPWCAAFVSFCMKNSGDATAADSVPKAAPARAATWRTWGSSLPLHSTDIPAGAVVVLSPTENNDSSGHVAFFARGDTNSVTLLGGNQSDQVKESTFARSRVVAIQWLDVAAAAGAGGPAQQAGIKMGNLRPVQQQMASLIISKFAEAGYGKIQQIAAVANAFAESSLDPKQPTVTSKEASYGLFQCNIRGGLGVGHTPEELMDANTNIAIIIAETRKFPSFGRATTLKDAVDIFVDFIERPADRAGQKVKRLQIAQDFMAS